MKALQSESGNTYFFPINPILFKYIQKHKLYDLTGIFLEIFPTFEYCDYLVGLVGFGKELLEKLYRDLKQFGL